MASSQSSVITQERKKTFLVQVYCGYCMDCMFVHLAMSLTVNLIHMSTLDFLHSIYRLLQLKHSSCRGCHEADTFLHMTFILVLYVNFYRIESQTVL